MSKIIVYENGLRRGSTSQAFNDVLTEELMREYKLSFSIVNTDKLFDCISEHSVIERSGQQFDLTGIDTVTGENNITQITAEHVSYRLNDYAIPAGYAYVGSIRQIAEDILRTSENIETGEHADAVFSIGSCVDDGTVSFRMMNTADATARDALISMKKLGVEIEFDNFTVNVVTVRGEDRGIEFTYDRNLAGTHRVYQRGNGWTYEINVADIDGVQLGDTVTVHDCTAKSIIKERVIAHVQCADDPTQNKITIGQFILDSATQSAETDRIANEASLTATAAKDKADTSLQEGQRYSNVYINHTDGFVAENRLGTKRVVQNGDDCFAVQVLKNGAWVTVNSVEEFGMLTPRLTTQEAKDVFYATIGQTSIDGNNYGMRMMMKINGVFTPVLEMSLNSTGTFATIKTNYNLLLESSNITIKGNRVNINSADGNYSLSDKWNTSFPFIYNIDANGNVERGRMYFENGLLADMKHPDPYNS